MLRWCAWPNATLSNQGGVMYASPSQRWVLAIHLMLSILFFQLITYSHTPCFLTHWEGAVGRGIILAELHAIVCGLWLSAWQPPHDIHFTVPSLPKILTIVFLLARWDCLFYCDMPLELMITVLLLSDIVGVTSPLLFSPFAWILLIGKFTVCRLCCWLR